MAKMEGTVMIEVNISTLVDISKVGVAKGLHTPNGVIHYLIKNLG